MTIGEFSRLTPLTVKTLRHCHEQGLLVPYAVDEASGYRRYSIDEVRAALLIGGCAASICRSPRFDGCWTAPIRRSVTRRSPPSVPDGG